MDEMFATKVPKKKKDPSVICSGFGLCTVFALDLAWKIKKAARIFHHGRADSPSLPYLTLDRSFEICTVFRRNKHVTTKLATQVDVIYITFFFFSPFFLFFLSYLR